ncbi:MAG: hypothetical protein WDZ83_08860 [Rhizobiaceae bacterium]
MEIDGIYSVVALGRAGGTVIVLQLNDGEFVGNDSSGSRYRGAFSITGDMIRLEFEVVASPGAFGVFGTSPSDAPRTLNDVLELPLSFFRDRKPLEIPHYEMTLIATRIPKRYEALAGRGGLRTWIGMLEEADKVWRS